MREYYDIAKEITSQLFDAEAVENNRHIDRFLRSLCSVISTDIVEESVGRDVSLTSSRIIRESRAAIIRLWETTDFCGESYLTHLNQLTCAVATILCYWGNELSRIDDTEEGGTSKISSTFRLVRSGERDISEIIRAVEQSFDLTRVGETLFA